jgi:kynurenine formamidase
MASSAGRVAAITPQDVVSALGLVRTGTIFDLDAGRFNGMPQWSGHPAFLITSFRTPWGSRIDGDIPLLEGGNGVDLRFHTELMVTGMHIGTHIDALNHVACGTQGDTTFGGYGPSAVGDAGPLQGDAASIPPIVLPCAIIDVPQVRGVSQLAAGDVVRVDDLLASEELHGPIPRRGAVLIRTGLMRSWPDPVAFDRDSGAGIDRETARWLAEERGACLVGSDTPTVEVVPSQEPENPHPVHDYLLRQEGIHLLENCWLEDLARDATHMGVLVCLPLKVRGATGSMVRPIVLT